ncbi:MAG: hypothetical protein HY046_07275 [Acidobacteria bacterium]|nr:hypothetical protein [Acidobacteriota bacterium]
MRCAVHTEVEATGFCRNCGKALCKDCQRDVRGILYCEPCLADRMTAPQAAPTNVSVGAATALGFVPGLGAVYNGEYMKAMIHIAVFATLVTLVSSGGSDLEPLFGISIAGFILYMVVDARRTAKAMQAGLVPSGPLSDVEHNKMIGPYILIGLGVVFLLRNFGWIHRDVLRNFWPLILIGVGLYMMRDRLTGGSR